MDIITAAAPDDPSLPFDGPRGYSAAGLAGLYFCDGIDTVSSIANAAGGAGTAVVNPSGSTAPWSAATLMTNGGINLRGNTILPGPTIDLTTPWTMFAHLAVGLPTQHEGAINYVSPILSTDQYINVRGVITYASIGTSYPNTGTQLNPMFRWFNSGAQVAPINLAAPADLTYLDPVTFVMSYAGGNLRARIFRSGAKIVDNIQAVTMANIVGTISNQKPTVSTNLTNYPEANLLCEAFGVYTRELTDADLITTDLMSIAVRQARGR